MIKTLASLLLSPIVRNYFKLETRLFVMNFNSRGISVRVVYCVIDTGYGLGDCRPALQEGRKYQMVKTQTESHDRRPIVGTNKWQIQVSFEVCGGMTGICHTGLWGFSKALQQWVSHSYQKLSTSQGAILVPPAPHIYGANMNGDRHWAILSRSSTFLHSLFYVFYVLLLRHHSPYIAPAVVFKPADLSKQAGQLHLLDTAHSDYAQAYMRRDSPTI